MKKFIAYCALFLAPLLIFAQQSSGALGAREPVRLSMADAVELAMKNNLSFQASVTGNEANRRAAKTPWNVFIPTVDVRGTLGKWNEKAYPSWADWGLSTYLSATLNLNAATFESIKKTRLDYEGGLITIEKAKQQLQRDVYKAYFSLSVMEDTVKLFQDSLAAAERRASMAQANYRSGLIPEVSLLQAQVARENMRPQLDEVENGYKMSMASLAMTLGLPYDTVFILTDDPGEVDFVALDTADLIAKAAANKPEILELQKTIDSLSSTRRSTFFNLYTPTLSLGYTMDPTYDRLRDPFKGGWFETDRWTQSSGMFSITLAWRLNGLLPFTTEHYALKSLDDNIKALYLNLALAKNGAEVEAYNTILQLEKTRATAEAQKAAVALAEKTYALSEAAFRSGLKEALEVLNDELAMRQARLQLVQQKYTYLNGLLDLEYAIGVPFGTLSGRNK